MVKKWIPIWAFPLVILFAIGTVWLRLSIIRTSYEIDLTSKLISNTRKEIQNVEVNIARLRSPRRLQELAKKKFNLNPPKPEQRIRLKR